MSNQRLIRSDEFGTYVITGGYVFRPDPGSKIAAGRKVGATHCGGTQTARVGDEVWASHPDWDPRYNKNWKAVDPSGFAQHVQACLDIANNNVAEYAPAYNNTEVQEHYRKRYEFLKPFLDEDNA